MIATQKSEDTYLGFEKKKDVFTIKMMKRYWLTDKKAWKLCLLDSFRLHNAKLIRWGICCKWFY